MDTAKFLLCKSVDAIQREHRCSRSEARARAAILLAADDGGGDTAPVEAPAFTLSARTQQIMREQGLTFAAAQSAASKDFRGMIVRGGRR